jgi:type II secretory pathway pseudopilin PulG
MLELVIVVVLVGILSVGAWTGMRAFRNQAAESTAASTLETVAGAQETYYISRGQWATSTDSLRSILGGGLVITAGPSTGEDVVSVGSTTVDGNEVLGMAVLARNGSCLTLILRAPGSQNNDEVMRWDADTILSCSGSRAGGI